MSRMRTALTRSLLSIPPYERLIAGFLIAAYLVLAARFSLGPIFEGSDEYEHYNYITSLAETRSLPTPAIIQAYDQGAMGEFHQPILYYLVTAPVIALAGNEGFFRYEERLNPYYPYLINETGNDNKNVFIHYPGEGLTSSGFARTVHLIRLLSVVFGLGTVLTSYAIFWFLWPRRPDIRLLALGFICFMPQFLFQSGMVSNDNLSYVLITLALLLTLVQVKQGPSWKLAVGLGIALGLGLLTKLSAAFMVFPVGLAVLLDRRSWRYAVVTVILVVLIAGWWYVRNWHLYGEPTGTEILYEYSAPAEKIGDGSFDLGLALDRVPYAYRTFWAQFLSVPVAPALYRVYDGLVVLALAGIVLRAALALRSARFDRQQATFAAIVAVFALAWVAAAIYWSGRVWSGNQGRFLLPGITVWGILAAVGLSAWIPPRIRLHGALALVGVFGVLAGLALFRYYLPAYAVADVPAAIDRPLALTFGDPGDPLARLIGMSPAHPRAKPGDTLRITLYWEALAETDRHLQVYLHTVETDAVRRDSLPATGNLVSTEWHAGQRWAEHYVIRIPATVSPQQVNTLIAGLYEPETGQTLAAVGPEGTPVTPIIGRIALNGSPAALDAPAYRFSDSAGDLFALAEPQIVRTGAELEVCVQWRAERTTPTDYILFVHLLDADGSSLAQSDGPAGGEYPTGAWARGEIIAQCRTVDAPDLPADARIALGLYRLSDFARLAVRPVHGKRLLHDMIVMENIP